MWVMIIIVILLGEHPAMDHVSFFSQEKCEAARQELGTRSDTLITKCVDTGRPRE
jgi:hypothetical protein